MSKKKKQPVKKTTQDKAKPDKAATPWTLRALRFTGRWVLRLCFLFYLSSTAQPAWLWAQMQWVRRLPITAVGQVANTLLAQDRPGDLVTWIAMRPARDHATIIKTLTPRAGEMSARTFLLWSQWVQQKKDDDRALFWREYALFRLRFDALRCGTSTETEDMNSLLALLTNGQKILPHKITQDHLRAVIHQVLDFDTAHPARNDPNDTCPLLQKISHGGTTAPHENWEIIRTYMHKLTLRHLEKTETQSTGMPETRATEKPQAKKSP